jgi:hypothetical protein
LTTALSNALPRRNHLGLTEDLVVLRPNAFYTLRRLNINRSGGENDKGKKQRILCNILAIVLAQEASKEFHRGVSAYYAILSRACNRRDSFNCIVLTDRTGSHNGTMGFALWLTAEEAWAAGTHEYRPMGTAVIARNGQFRARDFHRERRAPDRRSPAFIGLYGSLEEVNAFLRSQASEKKLPRPQVYTRSII